MNAVWAEFTPIDRASGAAVTLRLTSANDVAATAAGGLAWRPAILRSPGFTRELFAGSFSGALRSGAGEMDISLTSLSAVAPAALAWGKRPAKIWFGALGTDPTQTSPLFSGLVASATSRQGRLTLRLEVDDRWMDNPLLGADFAGTGGAEGGADLAGTPKPLAVGAPRGITPVLVDAPRSIFVYDGYGLTAGVAGAFERGTAFPASVGDFADYPSLEAAVDAGQIPAGFFATAAAAGAIAFGAPVEGTLALDLVAKPGIATPGQVLRELALLAGADPTKIDQTALDNLDAELAALDPTASIAIAHYERQQQPARRLLQAIAQSCNASAGVDWSGKFVVPRTKIGAPVLTLRADATARPPVLEVEELETDAPFWRLKLGADRNYTVHALSEIAFSAALTDRGDYDAATIYREGDIVRGPDSRRYLYISPTPTSGNAPPNAIVWSLLEEMLTAAAITGQGALATRSSVDLATADVTNKSADNIAESAARKWAAESGANVTETRTAADTANVSGTPSATVRDGAAKADAGLDASGFITQGINADFDVRRMIMSANGTQLSANPEFVTGTTGYSVYNLSGGGAVTIAVVSDDTAPNGSGKVLQIDYDGIGPVSPNFGGTVQILDYAGAGKGTSPGRYVQNTQVLVKVWAKIPVGRSIVHNSNPTGTGGGWTWLTDTAGTGDWQLYAGIRKIGIGGTLSSTGFFSIAGGANAAFAWWIARYDQIDITSAPSLFVNEAVRDTTGGPLTEADLITAQGTAAAIAGQGALATRSAVDLATTDVLNRVADNIAFATLPGGETVEDIVRVGAGLGADLIPESAARKWAAESGANVTETRTAAAIAGQGALATRSSVDLATADVTNKSADNIAESGTRKWAAESGADVTGTRLGGQLENGSFEAGFDAWQPSSFMAIDTGTAHSGTQSLRFIEQENGVALGLLPDPSTNYLPTAPGARWVVEGWAKRDPANLPFADAKLTVRFAKSDGVIDFTLAPLDFATLVAPKTVSGWQFLRGTFTVPALAEFVIIEPIVGASGIPAGSGGSWFWDDLRLLPIPKDADDIADGTAKRITTTDEATGANRAFQSLAPDARLADARRVRGVQAAGLVSAFSVRPITGWTDTGAAAQIDIQATTLQVGGAQVSYPAGAVSGLAYATTYHIYRDDTTLSGGGTYLATTSQQTATAGEDRVYFGAFTTGTAGGSGGGAPPPGAQCVAVDMWLRPGRKAAMAAPGVEIDVLTPDGRAVARCPIDSVEWAEAACVEIASESGIRLVCSTSTPLTLEDGSVVNVLDGLGRRVPVIDAAGLHWEAITSLRPAGMRRVARIHVGGRTYAAGAAPDRRILTHNPVKP